MYTFTLSLIAIVSNLARFLSTVAALSDSLTAQNPYLSDGPDYSNLVSRNGNFELGFFSPGVSYKRYLGIWFKDRRGPTSVWVANRENPINDSSGVLMMDGTNGDLILYSHNTTIVWSAKLLTEVPNGTLQLLDTGNLVLRDEKDANSENYAWQSFDYPTDTLLPGMKLGWDLRNNISRSLTAWENPNDPSHGNLSWRMELHEYPEAVVWKGSQEYFRHGPWNGVRITSIPLGVAPILNFNFVSNEDEVYYQYSVVNRTYTVMVVLNQSNYMGILYLWSAAEREWRTYTSLPRDFCDNYALCGAYGFCDIRVTPSCKCLQGFKPKSPDHWKAGEFADGCERNKPMGCGDEVGFAQFTQLKLPDTKHTWVNKSMNLEECREKCLSNCSCMAYANTNISGSGSGCVLWVGDLIDLNLIPDAGQDLYVRLLASELVKQGGAGEMNRKVKMVLVGISSGLILAILLICFYFFKMHSSFKGGHEMIDAEDLELPLFDLSLINSATNNFSLDNKLGEGGFGPVYKGMLTDGQAVAVKRLSLRSGQGMNEFKNEVILFSKLQHRNLVRLLGCCIQGEEKMLIYEYMPNKSLDYFLFDRTRRSLLDWSTRYHIISGIARGLVYLHQDSRLRIIHRDLKAGNVLLDADMNPKISDFGLAKTCGGDQTEGVTSRVVGTYGYMAPEYAFDGQFSVKSDAFSYGILLLEIISGKRSRGFCHVNEQNLIGYAWRLWKEGDLEELIDDAIRGTCDLSEVLRCIHISLLCVQQNRNDRPSMSSVVMMLGCEIPLPEPKQPGFFIENEAITIDCDSNNDKAASNNELTITLPDPR